MIKFISKEIVFNKISYILLNNIPLIRKIVIRSVKKYRIVKFFAASSIFRNQVNIGNEHVFDKCLSWPMRGLEGFDQLTKREINIKTINNYFKKKQNRETKKIKTHVINIFLFWSGN